jgi:EAL domain-containing protein (putative c-di-GMP-specific phosphodiesterase class I)
VGKAWFLESVAADGTHLRQPIQRLPFGIGRDPGNDLALETFGLSRQHARIDLRADGGLSVTDLGSTNGTFINGEPIAGTQPLAEDDVLRFGNAEFRVGLAEPEPVVYEDDQKTRVVTRPAQVAFVPHQRQFEELLTGHGMAAAAQPIVHARSGAVFAYELLGRCTHPGLHATPIQLFHLAAALEREADLSAAFRDHGVKALTPKLKGQIVFVNTHPKETFEEGFFTALERLSDMPGAPALVVEVHETAVMEVARMRELAARLKSIGVRFAYDDFGAGQARLAELGEVPPYVVKFDMGLIRGIHEAPEGKQRVVRDLVQLVLKLRSVPLAEGVETEQEAAVCREMGFELIQGYLTGRPVPVQSL